MSKTSKRKLLVIAVGLLVLNLLLASLLFALDDSSYEHLDGRPIAPHSDELIRSVVVGQLVSVPIISFLLGLIVAIFINRQEPYSRRILPGFLYTLIVIYALHTAMAVLKVLTFL
ncbi:MAG: hypothetical protein K1X47_04705 [Cyclobacteriaceae bacterium]|nr:hypothetical protein [Cyclobacteriaceae bacterium]